MHQVAREDLHQGVLAENQAAPIVQMRKMGWAQPRQGADQHPMPWTEKEEMKMTNPDISLSWVEAKCITQDRMSLRHFETL